jgi:integrase/recombinase XerD
VSKAGRAPIFVVSDNDAAKIEQFLDTMWMEKGLSENTLRSYGVDLKAFTFWLDQNGSELINADYSEVQAFLAYRFEHKYSARSTARMISTLRRFYRYQYRSKIIAEDPTALIELPKIPSTLPKILSEDQVEALLDAPDTKNLIGYRDRTMLELIYACGLRVSELVGLQLEQVELSQGWVRVIGKGNKERLVPIGDEALYWLDKYIREIRPDILKRKDQTANEVFVTNRAKGMTRQAFWYAIKKYATLADIGNKLSPHTMRHAFATHLLNHGADLRVVQMLLGHSNLSTTQIYTYVANQRLQDLYDKHHPRA